MKENESATSISISIGVPSNGKNRYYKFWVLSAILLLAFWSLFTGSITLKSTSGNLSLFSDDVEDFPNYYDFDILEIEEREKVARHMWDVYIHGKNVRLPRFWQQAFKAAYEELMSDVVAVRDAAILEIAKMSISSINLDPPPAKPTSTTGSRKRLKLKHADKSQEIPRIGNK